MTQYPLTDVKIRKLKPQPNKRFEIWDAKFPGFGVRVAPSGTKSFVLMYRLHGKPKRMTIGRYPALSLSEARVLAQENLNKLAHGEAPEKPDSDGATSQESTSKTNELVFEIAVQEFVAKHCSRHNKTRTAQETDRLLRQHFVSRWASRPLNEIDRQDVIIILDALVDAGKGSSANHALAAVRKFFNWCKERGLLETSPCEGIKAPAKNVSRSRVLSDPELASIWEAAKLQSFPFGNIVHLLILTGQRRSEVGEMRWEDIDIERKLWTIPEEMNKSGRPHSIPLTDTVLQIIQSVPRQPSHFLFPSLRTPSRVFSGYSKCKNRLDKHSETSDWRLHDIRRTVATGMAKLEVPPHVVERLLNHSSGTFGGVAGIYNRFGYLPEMRAALEKWERYVLEFE